jgi:hypothetical protein
MAFDGVKSAIGHTQLTPVGKNSNSSIDVFFSFRRPVLGTITRIVILTTPENSGLLPDCRLL